MRLVSLACSNTEIVAALGCADWLVGVDDHSDFPAAVVRELPRLGPDLEIDIDAVCDLEPDLVLASLTVPGHERVVEGLENAGLEYLAPEPVSLEDVYRTIREIAHALGVAERGEALVREMRAELVDRGLARTRPRVIVQWWNRPTIAPGALSWVTDLLELAGFVNPIGRERVKSRPVSDDELGFLNPDVIVLSWCGVNPKKYRPEVVAQNRALHHVQAVKKGQIYCIPEAYLGRPGPRLVEGYRSLLQIAENLTENVSPIK